MADPKIESLLILQERDRRRLDLEQQLASIPGEIVKLEARIAGEREKLDSAKTRVRELEVSRKELDNQVASAEQQIVRYKNQQLQVKKNEEYQALTHEIDTTREKMGKLEEETIGMMLEIDEERTRLREIERGFQSTIEGLEARIGDHRTRAEALQKELEGARAEVEEARAKVERPFLAAYDRQSRVVRFPLVVPVVDRACQGCHLKVSGGIEGDIRDTSKITTCDSCGRILYFAR
jgi:uncharacterized protein